MPSPCLTAPASTSARPRLACPSQRRGALGYDMPMPFYRLLLSCSKAYTSISLHAREAVVVLAMAKQSALPEHVI